MTRKTHYWDPTRTNYNSVVKPAHHYNHNDQRREAAGHRDIKPFYGHTGSSNHHNEINPKKDAATATIIAKQNTKVAKEANKEMMEQVKLHIGKAAIGFALEKYYLKQDPSLKSLAKLLATYSLSDWVQSMDNWTNFVDKTLASLNDNQKEIAQNLFLGIAINSLIEQRMPNMNDLILFGVPEAADYVVHNQFSKAYERFESRFNDRAEF